MPRMTINGAQIHVEDRGNRPETIVFSHGLLWSGRMFDNQTPPKKAERTHAMIPSSKLIVIPGAGHTSTVEEPAAVSAAIDEFLTSLRTPG